MIFFILSCSSAPMTHYYYLDYGISHKDNNKYPYVLGIEEFNSDDIYNRDNIIFREIPYEIQYYIYKRWASYPKTLISEKVLEHLKASALFKSVRHYPDFYNIDYLLRGNIKKFDELDKTDGWYANFSLEIEFLDIHKDSTLFVLRTDKMIKAKEKNVLEIVIAMSKCVQETFNELTEKIDKILYEISSE
ncbi:hypothetical protein ACFL4Z_03610 [candidate division KSB1 bacterium]